MWRSKQKEGTPKLSPQPSKGNVFVNDPLKRGKHLEDTMTLSLKDLPECTQKETVMVIWAELVKTMDSQREDSERLKEVYDGESTKSSQLEMQLTEERNAKGKSVQTIEVMKKGMKELFEVACSVAGSDEGVVKIRRKYEDVQEAVLAVRLDREEEAVKGSKKKGGTQPAVASPSTAPTATPTVTTTAPLSNQSTSAIKSLDGASGAAAAKKAGGGIGLPWGGKARKEKQKMEEVAKCVALLNQRAEALPEVVFDPRVNLVKVYMNTQADVERHLTSSQRKEIIQQELKLAKQNNAKSPRFITVGPKSGVDVKEKLRGTLASQKSLGSIAQLPSAAASTGSSSAVTATAAMSSTDVVVVADVDEDEEEEDEERTTGGGGGGGDGGELPEVASPETAPPSSAVPPLVLPVSPRDDETLQTPEERAKARMTRVTRSDSMVDAYKEGYQEKLEGMLRALKTNTGDQQHKRIVAELINTEEDYVHDLDLVQNVFGAALKPLISDTDYQQVFSNTFALWRLHEVILADLKVEAAKPSDAQEWGSPFTKHANGMRAEYDVYTGQQAQGRKVRVMLERVPEVAATLARLAERPEVRALDLKSYLIKPVQRICKYPLLLRELQKSYQSTGNDAAAKRLEGARLAMGEILESTNDQMVISEGRAALAKMEEELNAELEPPLQLVLSTPRRQYIFAEDMLVGKRHVKKKKRSKPQKMTVLVTSDCVLALSLVEGEEGCKLALPLQNYVVSDVGDGALPDDFGDAVNVFELYSPFHAGDEKRWVFYASTPEQKYRYVQAVAGGVEYQKRLQDTCICTLCGSHFKDASGLKEHASSCLSSSASPAVRRAKVQRRPSLTPADMPPPTTPASPGKTRPQPPTTPPASLMIPLVEHSNNNNNNGGGGGGRAAATPLLQRPASISGAPKSPRGGGAPQSRADWIDDEDGDEEDKEDMNNPEEVVSWLRADPARAQAASQLARKLTTGGMSPLERDQWATLRSTAKMEKSRILLGGKNKTALSPAVAPRNAAHHHPLPPPRGGGSGGVVSLTGSGTTALSRSSGTPGSPVSRVSAAPPPASGSKPMSPIVSPRGSPRGSTEPSGGGPGRNAPEVPPLPPVQSLHKSDSMDSLDGFGGTAIVYSASISPRPNPAPRPPRIERPLPPSHLPVAAARTPPPQGGKE